MRLVCSNDGIAEKCTEAVENLDAVDNVFCWFPKKLSSHPCIGCATSKVVDFREKVAGNCGKN